MDVELVNKATRLLGEARAWERSIATYAQKHRNAIGKAVEHLAEDRVMDCNTLVSAVDYKLGSRSEFLRYYFKMLHCKLEINNEDMKDGWIKAVMVEDLSSHPGKPDADGRDDPTMSRVYSAIVFSRQFNAKVQKYLDELRPSIDETQLQLTEYILSPNSVHAPALRGSLEFAMNRLSKNDGNKLILTTHDTDPLYGTCLILGGFGGPIIHAKQSRNVVDEEGWVYTSSYSDSTESEECGERKPPPRKVARKKQK